MNFFSILNQVEQAEAVALHNAKTESFKAPVVEEQEEETPAVKPVKKTKQKPTEGAGAENIEQPETELQPEEAKED